MKRSWQATTALLAAVLLRPTAAPAAVLPEPWVAPPRPARERPYLGRAAGLVMSADGGTLALAYSARLSGGVAVLSGRDGSLLRVIAMPGWLPTAMALSEDGSRLLTMRGPRLVETVLATGKEQAIWERRGSSGGGGGDAGIWALAYGTGASGRVLALSGPRVDPMVRPRGAFGPLRLLGLRRNASPVQLMAWSLDEAEANGLHGLDPVRLLPTGDVIFAEPPAEEGMGLAREVFLHRDRAVPEVVVVQGAPDVPGSWSAIRDVSADGTRALAILPRAGHASEDVFLLDRSAAPRAELRQLTHPPLTAVPPRSRDVGHNAAISADGRRAAVVVEPIVDGDDHARLVLIDVEAGSLRAVDLVDGAGIGTRRWRSRFEAKDLLRRLRALRDARALSDPAAVGSVLGLRFRQSAPSSAAWRGTGDLAPDGESDVLRVAADRSARFFLVLQLAGPCVTVPDILEVFGDTPEEGRPSTIPPDIHGRTLRYRSPSPGYEVAFTVHEHCSDWVEMRQEAVPSDRPAR